MAARSTEQEVIVLMGTALTKEQVTPWLDLASRTVTRLLASAGLTDDTMADCEMLLTAFWISTVRDPLVVSESIGDASATYAGMAENQYGKMLLALDTSGLLAQAVGKVAGEIKAFGCRREDDDEDS